MDEEDDGADKVLSNHLKSCAECHAWISQEEARLLEWQKRNQVLIDALLAEKIAQGGSRCLGLPSFDELQRGTESACDSETPDEPYTRPRAIPISGEEASQLLAFLTSIVDLHGLREEEGSRSVEAHFARDSGLVSIYPTQEVHVVACASYAGARYELVPSHGTFLVPVSGASILDFGTDVVKVTLIVSSVPLFPFSATEDLKTLTATDALLAALARARSKLLGRIELEYASREEDFEALLHGSQKNEQHKSTAHKKTRAKG
jgi:hypothetical protein